MAYILQFKRVPHDTRRPIEYAWAVQVDRLSIDPAPHHGRVLKEPATVKAPMPGGREPKGVLCHLGHVACEAHAVNVPTGQPQRELLPCSGRLRDQAGDRGRPLFQLLESESFARRV